LESILPGLRDVRAPLAAGYLWLGAIWLAVHDQVPASQEEATGIWEPIFRLGDALSVLGIGIALSFGAYLLGILSQSVLVPPLLFVDHVLFSGRVVIFDDVPPDEPDADSARKLIMGPHLSFRSWWSLDLLARKAIDDIRTTLPDDRPKKPAKPNSDNELERPSDADSEPKPELNVDVFVNDWLNDVTFGLHEWSRVYASTGPLPRSRFALFYYIRRFINWLTRFPTQHTPYKDLAAIEISAGLALELDSVKNRLLTLEKDQFDLIDRLQAESKFRFSVIPPLVAIVVLLATNWSFWWLLGLIGVVVLFVGASRFLFSAENAVVDRLFAGDVKAPLLERLDREVLSAIGSSQASSQSLAATD
jgi:hypothetical protein